MGEGHRGRHRGWLAAGAAAALSTGIWIGPQHAGASAAPASPSSVTIGVDHVDPLDQQPQNARLFEYTDFYSRDVTVHRGETVDFQTIPFAFHIVAIAKDETKARAVYPIVYNDKDDPNAASGENKIGFGSSNFPIVNGSTKNPTSGQIDFTRPNGPPDCGVTAEPICDFTGGDQVQVAGPNVGTSGPADWNVKIDAPEGTYHYFCYIHPHMSGTLHVVDSEDAVTTQHEINEDSAEQFAQSKTDARHVEKVLNVKRHSEDPAGQRTWWVNVGASADDNHVAIDEMLPNPLVTGPMQLTRGDKIQYVWPDDHNAHSVFFPAMPPNFSNDVGPIGFDCDSGFTPIGSGPPCSETGEAGPTVPPFNAPFEVIGDPGTSSPGTLVTSQTQVVDAGVLFGEDYGLHDSSQHFSIRTDSTTAGGPAPYLFHCTIHDFMVGGFVIVG